MESRRKLSTSDSSKNLVTHVSLKGKVSFPSRWNVFMAWAIFPEELSRGRRAESKQDFAPQLLSLPAASVSGGWGKRERVG